MALSTNKIAYGAIPDGVLPSIFIEKIKIMPSDFALSEQEVEVTLSLQTTQWPAALLSGRYMVFVAFAHSRTPLLKMRAQPSWAKNLIRDPKIEGGITKHYLKVDQSYKNLEGVPIKTPLPRFTLFKKELKLIYKCPLAGLKNLFVYAVPYAIDLQATTKSGVDRKLKAMKIGTPVIDEIMTNGHTHLRSNVYSLREKKPGFGNKGEVWSGPVNYYKGKGFLGSLPGRAWNWSQPHPRLEAQTTSNQKILDLRFLNDIKKLSFANSADKFKGLSRRQRKDLEKTRKFVTAPAHISNCVYSRATNNELKLFFSIDYDRLARENTKLGNFIQNKESLGSCFQIENIRVFRTRVDPVNTEPNELTPGKISICGSNTKLSSEKFIGSLKNGIVKPVTFRSSNMGVANLVVVDADMGNKSAGAYEYKLYVDLVDTSVSAIARIANALPRFLSAYNKFLASADAMGQQAFNIKARMKRDQQFIRELHQDWKRLINAYMTSIEFIYGAAAYGQYGELMWRKNLITMVNPGNGDLQSMMMVGEIISNFNTNIQRLFKSATTPSDDSAFNVKSKIVSENSTRRKILVEHVFSSKYVRNASAQEGTDYLDDNLTVTNVDNFTNIPFSQYENRVNAEMTKFQVPRPNAPGVNKFGFFSPRRLNTQGSTVETSTRMLSETQGNGILNASLSPNSSMFPSVAPNNTEEVYNMEVDNILGSSDVSMVENRKPLIEVLADPKPISTKTILTSNYIFNPSFTKDVVSTTAARRGSQQFKIKQKRSHRSRLRRSNIARRIMNARALNFKRLPKPIYGSAGLGSLATAAALQEPSNVENNSSFGNSINFNSIAEVQYFDGYVTTGGIINLNAPIWRTLTQALFNKFKEQKANVLCRLLLVTKAFKIPNNYKLPQYDSLFILGDTAAPEVSMNYAGGSYIERIDALYARLKEGMKNVALNIEDMSSLVDPGYLSTPSHLTVAVIKTPPPPPPQPRRPPTPRKSQRSRPTQARSKKPAPPKVSRRQFMGTDQHGTEIWKVYYVGIDSPSMEYIRKGSK